MGATYLNSTAHAKCLVGNPQPPNRQPFPYSLRADSDISLVANVDIFITRLSFFYNQSHEHVQFFFLALN